MRRLRYSVASSLDGFIAGSKGEYDWITPDPSFDFTSFFREFDTLLVGRRTFEAMARRGQSARSMGMKAIVVSTTLQARDHADVTIVAGNLEQTVRSLKAEGGKDIWLSGGAALFRTLVDWDLVDTVELAVMPLLLGSGIKVLPEGRRCPLHLENVTSYPSGMLWLQYSVAAVRAANGSE